MKTFAILAEVFFIHMKQIINYLRDFFELTYNEAKSAFLFFILILLSLLGYYFSSYFTTKNQSEILIENFGSTKIPEKPEEQRNYGFSKEKVKIEHFRFNPNTASKEDLIRLGIPKWTANTIDNYRNKGGKFKFKEDLLKIYSIKPERYADLENFIDLPSKTEKISSDFDEQRAITESKPVYTAKPNKIISKFDINIADTTQLIQIKGIGPAYAKRIIKYRDILGGFYSLEQVSETYGLNPEIIPELKKYCTIGNYKKININDLGNTKHPYLKFKDIIVINAYRKQHGSFKSIDDLKNIKILDETIISKIEPYLSY
ncbi:hypothetical protein EGI22_23805 [Lacihabitans sp. LS3-19]|uniref:ComEA family DNA-binding protein n=1 Tax=Lacihabitans sp. LS3-19 TaxID=2487335 RepID=UPI0020CD8E6B|nr:helix-hairpin-helix domain-containing protein [Lacihabitans sp. LS3-19]MCP9770941.1 hypothetical protein [Lacihabitans sp. LS3-19]